MGFCKQCGSELPEDARFCEKCGTPVSAKTGNQSVKMQAESGERKQTYEGEIRKCPNCGDPIDAFEFICDKCGFNFSTSRMSTSQERLAAQLASIDAKMQAETKKNKKNDSETAIKYKEQKATCINTFAVANSVEEIVSFMMYASGNIDMTCVATSNENNNYDKGDHMIADAWIGKMEQMYQMAKVSFSDSPMFSQIEHIYTEKKKELKKTGIKKITSNPMFGLAAMMVVCFALLIGMYIWEEIKDSQQNVERSRMESMGFISAGRYTDYEKENFDVVKKQFEDMGFTNIELIDLDDAGIINNKADTVQSVSIKGNSSFERDDYFSPDDRVIISYH